MGSNPTLSAILITELRAASCPGIEFLEHKAPGDGRPYPADARSNDLLHWQTKLLVHDAEAAAQGVRAEKFVFVSPGVVVLSENILELRKGLLVRDPDGHALLLLEKQERNPMSHAHAIAELGQELHGGLAEARHRSDALFKIVRPDTLYDRPIAERHRIIFYIGHLEAFDWTLICRGAFGIPAFHEKFDQLFSFGIDPVDGGLPGDVPSDWPRLEEVLHYNRMVRSRVDECLLATLQDGARTPRANSAELFHVAVEHRLMHAETLAYMLHQLPLDRKIAQPADPPCVSPRLQPRMVTIPAGTATLGLAPSPSAPFGWDNEFEAHTVDVPAFSIDAYNVTNAQFLAFISADGYDNRSLWMEADWEWKTKAGINHPSFWTQRGGQWHYLTMFAEIPLLLDWPVYVSLAEASAYARWVGKSLPTEAQFHLAAFGSPDGGEREFPWGSSAPSSRHGNFDFQRWNPAPVGAHPAGNSAFGVADLLGNGWEWTSTVFLPFAGFEAFPFYPGYSANFFDGKHFVIKGGSAQTAARLLRRSFRNWFQPHYPYIYATFRCVEN